MDHNLSCSLHSIVSYHGGFDYRSSVATWTIKWYMIKEKHYNGCSGCRICAMSLEEKPVSGPAPSSGIQSDGSASDVQRISQHGLHITIS